MIQLEAKATFAVAAPGKDSEQHYQSISPYSLMWVASFLDLASNLPGRFS
jgi:hypothetical protein